MAYCENHPDRLVSARGKCSSCYNKWRRASGRWNYKQYYQDNKARYKEWSWLKKYGITREDYNKILEQQGGHCYFCSFVPPEGYHLLVDHDHNTGRVRGLVCLSHNQAIAKFGDSPDGAAKLLQYLIGGKEAGPSGVATFNYGN
jgi:hypothetical protein